VADAVRQAGPADVDVVAPLFDAYRQFYEQPSDLALARRFIVERLERAESVVFLAERDGRAVGFVQLYPLFSSTAAWPRRLWLLNDLFVAPEAAGQGIGRALWRHAVDVARRLGETQLLVVSDPHAAGFYARMGAQSAGSRPSEIDPARPLPMFRLRLDGAAADLVDWNPKRPVSR